LEYRWRAFEVTRDSTEGLPGKCGTLRKIIKDSQVEKHMHSSDTFGEPDRLQEVARILAVGILRLHSRTAKSRDGDQLESPNNLQNSVQDSLELPEKPVLSVHTG
jgi:hypothetical protein